MNLPWVVEGVLILFPRPFRCGSCRRNHRRITAEIVEQVARTGAFACRRCGFSIPVRGQT